MKLYHKYFYKNFFVIFIFITFIISILLTITQSIKLLDLIISTGISIQAYLKLCLLIIPTISFYLVPFSIFASIIVIYNKMHTNKELIILKSSGLTNNKIAAPAITSTIIIMLLHFLLSTYLMPLASQNFANTINFFQNKNYTSIFLHEKTFIHPNKYYMFYFEKKEKNGELKNLFFKDNKKQNNHSLIIAKSAKFIKQDDYLNLELYEGSKKTFNNNIPKNTLKFDHMIININLETQKLTKNILNTRNIFYTHLFKNNISKQLNISPTAIEIEKHFRVLWPLTSIPICLLGLGTIINGEYRRKGKKGRIISASIICFIISAFVLATNFIAAQNSNLVVIVYAFIFVTTVINYKYLKKS